MGEEQQTREATWTGSEDNRHEQGTCLPPSSPPLKVPRYLVPVGVRCSIKKLAWTGWQGHTTTKETGFESYESYKDGHYEFRLKGWIMKVYRGHVVHREDSYPRGV
jgi:hypothetical protein